MIAMHWYMTLATQESIIVVSGRVYGYKQCVMTRRAQVHTYPDAAIRAVLAEATQVVS